MTARTVALTTIRRVIEDGAYSNIALAAELERAPLAARDRALAAELAYGTIRRLISLDRAIEAVASRPLSSIDRPTIAILRLGAEQLLHTRIPAHAAVDETVSLAPARSRAFANAVLRRLASAGADEALVRPASGERDENDGSISARTGMVEWAVAELRRVLPHDEVAEVAASLATSADVSLRVNRCRARTAAVRAELEAAGADVRAGRHHPDVLLVRSATPARLPGFAEGRFTVQDEGSVLVAAALGVRPGERVLDACAGPGGKASMLACAVGTDGFVVGADARPHRAALVAGTARRLGVPVGSLVQDARRPAMREASFDAILVDAPCSGIGAARRRPELLWRPSRTDLARLARLQVGILAGAAPLVRPGGRVLYSVCTFPRAETDAAVRAFLARHPEFEPMAVPGPDGVATAHRLWPHRHGTDAMFYAGLRRR